MTIRRASSLRTIGLALLLSSCSSSDSDKAVPVVSATPAPTASSSPTALSEQNLLPTATPIKHLVVIFGENQSFDHYFGTYPQASNPAGEPA
ncbi:MAG: hypothetical protein EOP65_06675, partial [Sphingomonas sp.]